MNKILLGEGRTFMNKILILQNFTWGGEDVYEQKILQNWGREDVYKQNFTWGREDVYKQNFTWGRTFMKKFYLGTGGRL